jgi:adenylate cyclase
MLQRRIRAAALAALIPLASASAALLLVRPPSPLAAAQRLFEAVAFRLLAPLSADGAVPPVVIAGITPETLARFPYSSPIDRGFLADLIDRLAADHAAAIGLDVLLDRPTEPAKDAALQRAIRRRDVPVVVITLAPETPSPPERRQFLARFVDGARTGTANLARDRFDDMVRIHVPRHPATRQLSFPAGIAAALGVDVPAAPFPIAWQRARTGRTFPVYPAETVALLPPSWIAGKAVLIGSMVPGSDEHRTLASAFGPPSFGVEIHAQVLAQLLEGSAHPALPAWIEPLAAAGMAAAGTAAGLLLTGYALAGSVAGLILLFLAAVLGAYAAGLPLLPAGAPLLAALLAAAGTRAWRGRGERRDRQVLRLLFSRFVSAPVAEEIMRERDLFLAGGRPKPQELMVTVLFSDVAGFTSICEQLAPEPLIGWLEHYIDTMVRIVTDHHGVVLRFVGDGILTVFGAPVPRRDATAIAADARNAARCALAMEAAMRDLNAHWRAAGLPVAGLRIGIHTGPLVAGSLGQGPHMEFCLLGDTANTGARLEQLGKQFAGFVPDACTIVVGEPTWQLLDGAFAGERVGVVQLRGKQAGLGVWRIDSGARTAPPAPATAEAGE